MKRAGAGVWLLLSICNRIPASKPRGSQLSASAGVSTAYGSWRKRTPHCTVPYPTVPGFMGGGTGQIQPATGGSVISLPSGSPQESAAAAAKLAWTRTLEFPR